MWRTAYWAVALHAVFAPCFAQILTTPESGNRLIFVPQGIGAALIKPEVHVIDLGAGAQSPGERAWFMEGICFRRCHPPPPVVSVGSPSDQVCGERSNVSTR